MNYVKVLRDLHDLARVLEFVRVDPSGHAYPNYVYES